MDSPNETIAPQLFTCTKCNTEKPVSDFYRNSKCTRGHQAHCKKCHALTKKQPRSKVSQEVKLPPEPIPVPTNKKCTKCLATKLIAEFNKNKNIKDGYNSQCRICHNKYFTDRVTTPRKTFIEPFNDDRKKYILSKDPKDYKQYVNISLQNGVHEDNLGAYKKYPLPLKYFECYLLYKKEDKIVDKRHPASLELITQYEAWIGTDEYKQFDNWYKA
jgi:hypothetical protein